MHEEAGSTAIQGNSVRMIHGQFAFDWDKFRARH